MKSLTLQQHREIDQRIDNLSRYAKKGAYINYRNHPGLVNQVLEIIKYFRRDDISKIAQATGFKLPTLYDWRKKLAEDPHFNPLITHYGEHLRIFTDAEEDALSDYALENIILKCIRE